MSDESRMTIGDLERATAPVGTHGNTGNQHASFWDKPWVVRAQRAIDVWASWEMSRRFHAACPTLDAIFEFPAPKVAAWRDEISGLLIVDEEYFKATSTTRPLSEVELVAHAVSVALLNKDEFLEIARPALLRIYPRTGPYVPVKHPIDEITGPIKSIERCAIRTIDRAMVRTRRK